ncbi:glycosyltransferase [Pelagibacterales bacterium SAG-MED39]|nr:glycosyltransferase [Pelagibacterales bacterium SAG-MED39]
MISVFYWGPFIDNRIATVKAIYNSALGINKYSNKFRASIVNSIGEWNFKINKENSKNFLDQNLNIYNQLPKFGFMKSRISYLLIFILCFFQLLNILKKHKPDIFIAHLIVSLPLVLFRIFNFKSKLIIRISGKPKLNTFRKFVWKFGSKNVYKVFCPTSETKEILRKKKIFDEKKIFVVTDPVFNVKNFCSLKKKKGFDKRFEKNNIIMVGRLTYQKNFDLIIDAYIKNDNLKNKYKIFILGAGELENSLKRKIKSNNLHNKIIFLGHKNNVIKYMKSSDLFISTSLWEDPGFVLIEAALSNISIISSDCPSGPKEIILENESGGYLFKNNNQQDLNKKINQFLIDDKNVILEKKIYIKKNIKKFSVFNHVNLMKKYL